MAISKKPRYNLSLILQETGLKADTIRAWERRYNLPLPARSEGGHRLYSDYDLATIKWLVSRQKEGMRISQAVNYWMELIDSDTDPLQQDKPQSRQVDSLVQMDGDTSTLEDLQQKWIDYCLDFDEPHAEQILSLAFAQFPLETVLTAVILPSINKVGQLWYQGEATVQQEHFISEIAIKKIQTLITAAPNPVHNQRIMMACSPGEQHTITLLVLTLLLKHRGWDVVYLGANVPNERLNKAIEEIKPALTVLSASRLSTAAALLSTMNILIEKQIPTVFGGWIFDQIPDLVPTIPGNYLGPNIPKAISMIESLINSDKDRTKLKPLISQNRDLVKKLQAIRPELDRAMLINMPDRQKTFDTLDIFEANQQLIQDISAALTLGDINYLRFSLDWISGLINARKLEYDQLVVYLNAFRVAIEDNLGSEGKIITDWLRNPVIDNQ